MKATVSHLSNDLILVASVSSSAKQAAIPYRNFPGIEKLLASFDESADPENLDQFFVIVDLQLPGLDFRTLSQQVRARRPEAKLIAYAQHVRTDLIDSARSVPDSRILTRGQFSRTPLSDLLESE